jgi:hypothetical protein
MRHEKVWESHIFREWSLFHPVDAKFLKDDLRSLADLNERYRSDARLDVSVEEYPEYIFFEVRDLSDKRKNSLPDIFSGLDGYVYISGALYDLMQKFELGETRFKEVPFYEYDQTTLRPGRWYFMHVREDRRTHVQEASTGLEPLGDSGQRWRIWPGSEHQIAVNPENAADLDLWHDSAILGATFFSDRLREAINSSGLKTQHMGFRACKVVTS